MFRKKKKEEERSIWRLKRAILEELFQDYPEGAVFGKVEHYLRSKGYAVDVLENHDIIERLSQADKDKLTINEEEKKRDWYRLTSKGVDLAISFINLEHSENIEQLTKRILIFAGITILITIFFAIVSIVPPLALTVILVSILVLFLIRIKWR